MSSIGKNLDETLECCQKDTDNSVSNPSQSLEEEPGSPYSYSFAEALLNNRHERSYRTLKDPVAWS